MTTSELFNKHFGDTLIASLSHPNAEAFFEELKEECLLEDMLNGKRRYYAPSGSYEYYNEATDTWYNSCGQELRDPSEYDQHSEGYIPFGDE
jgi:hypothetical protein